MKYSIVILVLFVSSNLSFSQDLHYTNPAIKTAKPIIKPIFIDSTVFYNELITKTNLLNLFNELKKEKSEMVFSFLFTVKKKGLIKIDHFSTNPLYKNINGFLKKGFSKYHWKSGRDIHNQHEINVSMVFEVYFNTEKKQTICSFYTTMGKDHAAIYKKRIKG